MSSLPSKLIRVIVESPYAGDVEKNLRYLRACMGHCFSLGEAPFASHGLYPGCLDDSVPNQRELGLQAGFEWGRFALETVVYTNLGITEGMLRGIAAAVADRRPIEYRTLPGWQ